MDYKTDLQQKTKNILARKKIRELKNELASTDYKAIKFAEGEISKEDYEPVRLYRRDLRMQARKLLKEIE